MIPLPATSTLFPYTTLFRSWAKQRQAQESDVKAPEVEEPPLPSARNGTCDCLSRGTGGGENFAEMPQLSLRATKKRSEEHTSELQSLTNLVCRLLLEKKNRK